MFIYECCLIVTFAMRLGWKQVFEDIFADKYHVEMHFFWKNPTPEKWVPYCPFSKTTAYTAASPREQNTGEKLKP